MVLAMGNRDSGVRMNILYSFRTRGVGAEAVHISGIARAFERLGNKVYFQSPCKIRPGSDPFRKERGKAFFWNMLSRGMPRLLFEMMELSYNIFSWFRIRRHLKTRDFGIIYERHAFFLFSTGSIARRCNVPLIVEVNELTGENRVRSQPLLSRLAGWCDQRLFDRASLIVVVSPYLKREIMKRHGVADTKIEVHCNGIDEDMGKELSGARIRSSSPVPAADCIFGFVGWFVEWHRLDLLVEVFSMLCHEQPHLNAGLLLVGDGPLRNELSNRCKELGISDKVKFAGAIEHSQMPKILKKIDIAVIPHSNQYRSPIKLFEYMAGKCAVIAAGTEPISMVINHGVNGLLFTPLDKEEMLQVFMEAASDSQLRTSIGRRAHHDVLQSYTWKHNAQGILGKVEEMACRKP